MQDTNQYRDPPPYPGHTKQLYQPGTRKSYSGSETSTDVSLSSSENLSTSQRQEPQGQENNQPNVYYPNLDSADPDAGYSILARLGMPQSFMGKPGQDPHQQWTHPSSLPPPHPHVSTTHELNRPPLTVYQSVPNINPVAYSHSVWSQNSEPIHMGINPGGMSYYTLPPPPEYPGMPVHRPLGNPSMDVKDITRQYDIIEKSELSGSRSQPELGRYVTLQTTRPEHLYCSSGDLKMGANTDFGKLSKLSEWDHSAIATRASRMVEMLSVENKQLREDLNLFETKVSKLQKFEFEIQRVHESYESLVKSSHKRETLEATLKKRMEEEIKRLQSENRLLKEQLESGLSVEDRNSSRLEDTETKKELSKRKYKLLQALSLNQELTSNNDCLDLKVKSQNSQIGLMETALSSAQTDVARLEEECQKKQMYMDKVEQLQKALSGLQLTCEKREMLQQQLLAKLEKELDVYRSRELPDLGSDVTGLTRLCHMKEAKLLQLEGELIKWEQRFLEESAKKLSLEGETKDARLVALSQSSKETEKLISEAKAEKLKNMEELYQSNRKVTELEARVKSLESQLSEKEAMVKVLQRSTMTRSTSVHSIYCSPLHSPRPSLISHMAGQLSGSSQGSSPSDSPFFREYDTIKHIKTSSASSVELNRLSAGDIRDNRKSEKQRLSDSETTKQERTLWHV